MGGSGPDGTLSSLGSPARRTRGELSAVQRLVLVQTIAERLAGSQELSDLADTVVELAKEHLGAVAVTIRLRDPGRTEFLALRAEGDPDAVVALATACDAVGARLVVDPLSVDNRYGPAAQREPPDPSFAALRACPGVESWAVLPLVARRQAVGVVALGWERRRRPRPADTAMLGAIAHQCALAIDRARVIDAERSERETLELLAAATRVMGSALDPDEVVRRLVQFSVPRLAPWCAVYVHENGRLERVAIEVAGHGLLADALRRSNAIDLGAENPVAVAFRTGHVQVVPVVTAPMVASAYEKDMATRVLSLPGDSWSAIAVPVYASGRVIGVFTLVSNSWEGDCPPNVRIAAEGLAGRAGLALANARRFAAEHDMARRLAQALLPAQVPTVPGYSAAARYIPAGGPVAGDWFDLTRLPTGEFLIGVGDAAGHGVAATSLMALVRSAAQGLAVAGHSPAGVLDGLNKLVAEHDEEGFATALYACLDVTSGKLRWSSAGHLPPLAIRDGSMTLLTESPGPPLGLPGGADRHVHTLQLDPGDGLVLVTDGVIERRDSSIRRGLTRLVEVVSSACESLGNAAPSGRREGPDEPAQLIADRIAGDLCLAPQDDCCIVAVVRDGEV